MQTIHLPATGKRITIAEYTRSVSYAKAHPTLTFRHGLTGWWPATGHEIAQQFRHGIHDRINLRGNVSTAYRQESPTRLRRRAVNRVRCECRWCGSSIPYNERERRFCDASCRSSYYF